MRLQRESWRSAQVWKRLTGVALTVLGAAIALAIGLSVRPFVAGRSAAADTGNGPALEVSDGQVSMANGLSGENLALDLTVGGLGQEADGVELTVSNFRRDGNFLLADVCFAFPDKGDWTIWSASLRYEEIVIRDYSSVPIDVRLPEVDGTQTVITFANGAKNHHSEPAREGDMGGRCDTLSFELPSDYRAHKYVMTIDSIAAAPREGESCNRDALDKVQAAVNRQSEGINVGCVAQSIGGGTVEGFAVLGRPPGMAQEQAESIVFGQEVFLEAFGRQGPWTFVVPLD